MSCTDTGLLCSKSRGGELVTSWQRQSARNSLLARSKENPHCWSGRQLHCVGYDDATCSGRPTLRLIVVFFADIGDSRPSGARVTNANCANSPSCGTSRLCSPSSLSPSLARLVFLAFILAFHQPAPRTLVLVIWAHLILLQHHCRKCGAAVCHHCSSGTSPLPKLGFEHPVRLCKRCMPEITEEEFVMIIRV